MRRTQKTPPRKNARKFLALARKKQSNSLDLGKEGEKDLIKVISSPVNKNKEIGSQLKRFRKQNTKISKNQDQGPMKDDKVILLGSEDGKEDSLKFIKETEKVTSKDMLTFAKQILLTVVLLFVIVGVGQASLDTPGINDIWEFSKTFLTSVSTLILGYYFGTKTK